MAYSVPTESHGCGIDLNNIDHWWALAQIYNKRLTKAKEEGRMLNEKPLTKNDFYKTSEFVRT